MSSCSSDSTHAAYANHSESHSDEDPEKNEAKLFK